MVDSVKSSQQVQQEEETNQQLTNTSTHTLNGTLPQRDYAKTLE